MKTSKNKRIHKGWIVVKTVWHQGHSRFQYRCTGCGVHVLNGQPFSEVNGMECK